MLKQVINKIRSIKGTTVDCIMISVHEEKYGNEIVNNVMVEFHSNTENYLCDMFVAEYKSLEMAIEKAKAVFVELNQGINSAYVCYGTCNAF